MDTLEVYFRTSQCNSYWKLFSTGNKLADDSSRETSVWIGPEQIFRKVNIADIGKKIDFMTDKFHPKNVVS